MCLLGCSCCLEIKTGLTGFRPRQGSYWWVWRDKTDNPTPVPVVGQGKLVTAQAKQPLETYRGCSIDQLIYRNLCKAIGWLDGFLLICGSRVNICSEPCHSHTEPYCPLCTPSSHYSTGKAVFLSYVVFSIWVHIQVISSTVPSCMLCLSQTFYISLWHGSVHPWSSAVLSPGSQCKPQSATSFGEDRHSLPAAPWTQRNDGRWSYITEYIHPRDYLKTFPPGSRPVSVQ